MLDIVLYKRQYAKAIGIGELQPYRPQLVRKYTRIEIQRIQRELIEIIEDIDKVVDGNGEM